MPESPDVEPAALLTALRAEEMRLLAELRAMEAFRRLSAVRRMLAPYHGLAPGAAVAQRGAPATPEGNVVGAGAAAEADEDASRQETAGPLAARPALLAALLRADRATGGRTHP
ncbi:MAG: hypothetical protein IRZ13_16860 [Acetobacteraceae bacterium]|nr:hypothetical protein [Acetobacteraceae bacterium]